MNSTPPLAATIPTGASNFAVAAGPSANWRDALKSPAYCETKSEGVTRRMLLLSVR